MKFQKLKTGDRFYTRENVCNNIRYGVIIFESLQEFSHLSEAESVLATLLNGLQAKLEIPYSTGIVHETHSCEAEVGLTDYWQDAMRVDWKINGWSNKKRFEIFYIQNITEVSVAFEEYLFNTRFFGLP